MKSFRQYLSNAGILSATAILLFIAIAFAFAGISIQAHDPIQDLPMIAGPASQSVTLYVMTGLMGDIPSVAGTLQSIALAIAYGLTPLVVVSMFAARTLIDQHNGSYTAAA